MLKCVSHDASLRRNTVSATQLQSDFGTFLSAVVARGQKLREIDSETGRVLTQNATILETHVKILAKRSRKKVQPNTRLCRSRCEKKRQPRTALNTNCEILMGYGPFLHFDGRRVCERLLFSLSRSRERCCPNRSVCSQQQATLAGNAVVQPGRVHYSICLCRAIPACHCHLN